MSTESPGLVPANAVVAVSAATLSRANPHPVDEATAGTRPPRGSVENIQSGENDQCESQQEFLHKSPPNLDFVWKAETAAYAIGGR